MAGKKVVRNKKKVSKNIVAGAAHIKSTFNNTLVTITDLNGNVVSWASFALASVIGPISVSGFFPWT